MKASDKPVTQADLDRTIDKLVLKIGDMFAELIERLDRIEYRLDRVEERLDRVEITLNQHTSQLNEINNRLDKLENHTENLDDDVRHLYQLIEKLKKDFKRGTIPESEIRTRLEEVEAIAKQLMARTGLKSL